MKQILELILIIFLIGNVFGTVIDKRHDEVCMDLCHDIQEINEETEQKLRETETAINSLRTECICAFNKEVDARLHVIKKELFDLRDGCFCSASRSKCPEGWSLFQGICYSFRNEKLSWYGARTRCQEFGGTLAIVDTEEKDNYLINLVNQMGPGGTQNGPWLDGMKVGRDWVWMKTGEKLAYTNWWPGQPDGIDTEMCIEYWTYSMMKWNNARCSFETEFICEKPASV